MTNPVQLSKKELNKVFWRSYQALGCYTYDKQQGISYMRALLPALQKLYPDPEDLKEALKLDENSNILVISTEGDTDPVRYREIVWDGLYGTNESLSK